MFRPIEPLLSTSSKSTTQYFALQLCACVCVFVYVYVHVCVSLPKVLLMLNMIRNPIVIVRGTPATTMIPEWSLGWSLSRTVCQLCSFDRCHRNFCFYSAWDHLRVIQWYQTCQLARFRHACGTILGLLSWPHSQPNVALFTRFADGYHGKTL